MPYTVKNAKACLKIYDFFDKESKSFLYSSPLKHIVEQTASRLADDNKLIFDQETIFIGDYRPTSKPREYPKGVSKIEFEIALPLSPQMAMLGTFGRGVFIEGTHECMALVQVKLDLLGVQFKNVKESFVIFIRPLTGGSIRNFGTPINTSEILKMKKCCAPSLCVEIGFCETQPLFFMNKRHNVGVRVKNTTGKMLEKIVVTLRDNVWMKNPLISYSYWFGFQETFLWKPDEIIDEETSIMHLNITVKEGIFSDALSCHATSRTPKSSTDFILTVKAQFDGGYKAELSVPVILASLPADYPLTTEQIALGESIRFEVDPFKTIKQ